ncbi:MAG TPA: hypothetical protein VN641_04975 [Urbifossiella sp.]|jgi:hypothetical protein|nr:hypothetical protein [Urbifossiella sp.]
MPRAAILTSLVLLAVARPSRADTLPLIGLPTGYTPGVAVTFDITAPGLNGLTDYTLAFTVMSGPTSAPPDLTISAAPPATGYPFPDASNFFTETDSLGQNQLSFIIQDASSASGVNTVLGLSDRLAVVTIAPGATLSGPITVTFTDNTFDASRDVSFPLPAAFVIAELPPTTAVPAPPAWLLLGVGGLCLAGRQRLRRAA